MESWQNETLIIINGISRLGFRPNSSWRPENDVREMKINVETSKLPNKSESISISVEHDTLFELLQKVGGLGRSIFDIGEIVVNKASTSIAKANTMKIAFWANMVQGHGKDLATFEVEREDMPEHRTEGHCAYRLSSEWSFDTKIDLAPIRVDVNIQTTETRTMDAETVGGKASEIPFSQESRSAVSKSAAEVVHRTLFDGLKEPQTICSQALTSQLATLAYQLSDQTFQDSRLTAVSIKTSRHRIGVDSATETITSELSRSKYEAVQHSPAELLDNLNDHLVYVALGSNVGDRIAMIELACRELDRYGICVVRTSALYETEPMYLQEQRPFINGVCEVRTTLNPLVLLDTLKEIETALGRQKTVENGPRTIDLDILLYDDEHVVHERLIIPHKRILEREFVLRPLCDLIPEATLPPPFKSATFSAQLLELPKPESPLSPLTPLSLKTPPISSLSPTRTTHIMAVLNLTPDSFSDGNLHPTDPTALLPTLKEFLAAGVSILDIGGQSTRPDAPQITAEAEIARVLPTIKYIRSHPEFDKMAISIDTYRASVAHAAISAGADIVNDVSAGLLDENMFREVARLGCTVFLMHMRGTPENMATLTDYPSGVVDGVGSELFKRVAKAQDAGIRRWRIVLDPGIGFAKNTAQNLELLRRFGTLRQYQGLQGLPWTVGSSRKRFIGKITGVQTPRERVWGTAATVTAAVQGGADIVRVHDVAQMTQVSKMADAIWRV